MWYRKAQQENEVPPFYSYLLKTVEEKMGGKMDAASLKKMLTNAGVGAEEMRWIKLDKYLAEHPIVVKKDFIPYIKANTHAIARGLRDLEWEQDDGATTDPLYEEYALLGNDYREYLLNSGPNLDDPGFIEYLKDKQWGTKKGSEFIEAIKKDPYHYSYWWRSYLREKYGYTPAYTSKHFSAHDSPIAHFRTTSGKDRDGKKVFHVEEVQSDWHQAGKKYGYDSDERVEILQRQAQIIKELGQLKPRGFSFEKPSVSPEVQARIDALESELKEVQKQIASSYTKNQVPNAPFAKDWHELAMKHALDIAVREGYDKLSWNTGKVLSSLFSIAKHVDKLELLSNGQSITVKGWKDGKAIIEQKNVEPDDLSNVVGKGIAESWDKWNAEHPGEPFVAESEDLNVGGHGMSGFYDQILPSFMNKYTKKWNSAVKPIDLDSGHYTRYVVPPQSYDKRWSVRDLTKGQQKVEYFDNEQAARDYYEQSKVEHYTPVHSIDITPEMRQEILTKGQRLAGTRCQTNKKGNKTS